MASLKELVATRMAELGNPSPFKLARDHNMERSFINDILIDKKKRILDYTKLASALEVEPGALSEGRLVAVRKNGTKVDLAKTLIDGMTEAELSELFAYALARQSASARAESQDQDQHRKSEKEAP